MTAYRTGLSIVPPNVFLWYRYTGRRDDIGSGDLGAAVMASFENEATRGKTFELYGGGQLMPNWGVLLSQLELD